MGRDKIINVRIMKTGEMRSKLGENYSEAARVLFFLRQRQGSTFYTFEHKKIIIKM